MNIRKRKLLSAIKKAPGTVQHITAGLKMLTDKADRERHNLVAGIVHRNIHAEYGSGWKSAFKGA